MWHSKAQEELGKLKNEDDFGHNKEHALKDRIRFLSGAIGRTKSDLRSGIEAMDQARRSSRFAVLRKAKLVVCSGVLILFFKPKSSIFVAVSPYASKPPLVIFCHQYILNSSCCL